MIRNRKTHEKNEQEHQPPPRQLQQQEKLKPNLTKSSAYKKF